MPGVQDVDFRLRSSFLRGDFGDVEHRVIAAPADQRARLPLAQPILPRRTGGEIVAVVVGQVRLDIGLARPGKKATSSLYRSGL